MGAEICFTNHIHISEKSFRKGVLQEIGYGDVTQQMIEEMIQDSRIKWIQISQQLPYRAYEIIDKVLEKRQDLYFRIFDIDGNNIFDLSFLKYMPHLSRVWLNAYFCDNKNVVNAEALCELTNLKGLDLNLFDCRDYSFIKSLSRNLEELLLYADTKRGGIQFDCEWLLPYQKLHSLYLGKRAKKNLESTEQISELKHLSLRGIKVKDFNFLKKLPLDSFHLLWCGNSDLSQLGEMEELKELELWRIMKLENIDFISSLIHLESLKLRDLKHIKRLPDLSRLTKLKELQIDNVPVDVNTLDERIRKEVLHR